MKPRRPGGSVTTQSPLETFAPPVPPEAGEMLFAFRRDVDFYRAELTSFPPSRASQFYTAASGLFFFGLALAIPLATYYTVKPRPPAWVSDLLWGLTGAAMMGSACCLIAALLFGGRHRSERSRLVKLFDHITFASSGYGEDSGTGTRPGQEQVDPAAK